MHRGKLAGLVAVVACGAPIAYAQQPARWPPPTCRTRGALLAYYVGDGFTFNNDLVVRPDRTASLCWGQKLPRPRSGRRNFVLTRPVMAALKLQLNRIDIRRLGPPTPPPPEDMPTASLVFSGKEIPRDGYPKTKAAARALRHAEAILNGIITRHLPRT